MEASLFRIAVCRRLRQKVVASDNWCPMCGEVLDTFGDHALVCGCKGDRTRRHNRLRDVLHDEAVKVGLATEREKGNLLPPRPQDEGLVGEGARRPADVWWPGGAGGRGVAWDIAVTSAMKHEHLIRGPHHVGEVVAGYEHLKVAYHDTGQRCAAQGFDFQPLVFEGHSGGWSQAVADVVAMLGRRRVEGWGGEKAEVCELVVAQRLSVTLQRENARAIMRRVGLGEGEELGGGQEGGGWSEQAAEGWDEVVAET